MAVQGGITLPVGLDLKNVDNDVKKLANRFKETTQQIAIQSQKVDELKAKLAGLQSGSITATSAEVKKMQTEFDKTNSSIEKTKAEISSLYQQLDALQANAFVAPDTGEVVLTGKEQAQFDSINAKLDQLEPKLEADKQKAAELGESLREATGAATQAEINKTAQELQKAETKLDGLKIKADETGDKIKTHMEKTKQGAESASNSFEKMGMKLLGMAKRVFVFSVITKALRSVRSEIGSVFMANEQYRQSVYNLQAALYLVAVPIIETVIPAIQGMINWLTKAVLYIAAFVNGLRGRSLKDTIAAAKRIREQSAAYKKLSKSAGGATQKTKKQTKATKDLAKATKETNKQLAEFDTLLILQQKSIDNVNTPTGGAISGGGVATGIDSGLDGLSEFLDSEEFKNLQKFEQWVIDNKDKINTALEVGKWLLFGIAIGTAIKAIGELLGWFKKKDKGLTDQTKKTQEETDTVEEMSKAFSTVPALAWSIVPALNGLTQAGENLGLSMDGVKEKAYALNPAFATATQSAYETSPALFDVTAKSAALQPAFDGVANSAFALSPAINGAKTSVDLFTPSLQLANNALVAVDTTAKVTAPSFQKVVQTSTANATKNVETFSTGTKTAMDDWHTSVSTNAILTGQAIGLNVYNALDSAGQNTNNFVNSTSESIRSWSDSVSKNVARAALAFANNWGNALASAWKNYRDFKKATGEAIRETWSKHGAKIVGVTLAAAAVAGAIALSPYTGGASLAAIPALAQGTVIPPNKKFMAILGDQKSGTNVEAPLTTIEQAVENVIERMNISNGANQTFILELDGREVGRTFGSVIQQEKNRVGNNFVKTKLVFG